MSDAASEKWQAREQVAEALQECERHLRAVWDNVSCAMTLSSPDGTVLAANTAYFHLYGYPLEEVIGHNFSMIFPREQRQWAQELYNNFFQSPIMNSSFEGEIIRADGSERFVESSYNFITHNGTRIAMISCARYYNTKKN